MKFTKTYEWVNVNNDKTITIGITEHAQCALGDIVFVDLPKIGSQITAGKECAVVESVKSASDIYAPISGNVVEINESVVSSPSLINKSPQNQGWLFKINASNPKELDNLMDDSTYDSYIKISSH